MRHCPSEGNVLEIEMRPGLSAASGAYDLYTQALASEWPLSEQRFSQIGCHQVVLACRQSEPLGIALLDRDGTQGYIQVIAVKPPYQSQGIGSALLNASERWFAQHGVTEVHVGRGRQYLWQGAPEGCERFFRRHGYTDTETSVDMTLDLAQYAHPSWVDARLPPQVCIRRARREDAGNLPPVFHDEDLASWLGVYMRTMASGQYDSILLAATENGIVGLVLLLTEGLTWKACFPDRTGGLACLGVRQAYRNQGIGRALAAAATRQLKRQGMDTSYVGWTWLENWYGALGYRVWRRFHMMSKRLG